MKITNYPPWITADPRQYFYRRCGEKFLTVTAVMVSSPWVRRQSPNVHRGGLKPGGGKLPLKAWYRWAVWWIFKVPAARENQAWKAYPGLGKFCLKLNILSLKLFMEPISCTYFVKILHSRPVCREIFVKMRPCLGIFPFELTPAARDFPSKMIPTAREKSWKTHPVDMIICTTSKWSPSPPREFRVQETRGGWTFYVA